MKQRTWTGFAREDVIAMLKAEVGFDRGSQKDLAERIGISPSWLSDIMLGHRAPAGKVLEYLKLERHAIRVYRPKVTVKDSRPRWRVEDEALYGK